MAAGLGFKDFTTGEVLTAADVDGYLMQGIWVFASAAARDAAVTSPQEGNFAFTKDTNGLWYYDGAAWVSSGATGDIEGVTAGIGISGGGTSGTVTVTNSMATAIDAKGDLIVGTAADTFSRLPVGATDGHILTVDSAEATGMKWAAAGSSGGMTQIATGSLSGTNSLTISSISSSYKNLYMVAYDLTFSGSATDVRMRLNGITANNYTDSCYFHTGSTAGNNGNSINSYWRFDNASTNINTSNGRNKFEFTIYDYSSSSNSVLMDSNWFYQDSAGSPANVKGHLTGALFSVSAAVNSITFYTGSTSNFNGGTYILYGVS